MKLFNSLTKQVEDFAPVESKAVRMYSCGPTVYNHLTIGNLSAFIYADLLRRLLVASGYDVIAVMNITDVDDKTIRDSKNSYPELDSHEALSMLTRKYENIFMSDMERIGNGTKSFTYIRATETINEMIELTQRLLEKGIAYPAEDGIYFSIKDYELAGFNYGQLQEINRSHEQARITNDEYDKDAASDFALWKKSNAGEPAWPATFIHGNNDIDMPGRPGWHIECSAMSEKLLGTPFDIHTGGIDLKFPHHENEIAQSSAATDNKVFAKYFVHNNHILVDGKKMSKSLNNFYTLHDIEAKGYDPLAFRLLVLSSHYRSESNFTWKILDAAQNRLKNWQAVADLRWQLDASEEPTSAIDLSLKEHLQNDLDTPSALALIDQHFDRVENGEMPSRLNTLNRLLDEIESLLGINLKKPDISENLKTILRERDVARTNKDWTKSDELRDQLKEQGIGLRDTEHGAIWYRV